MIYASFYTIGAPQRAPAPQVRIIDNKYGIVFLTLNWHIAVQFSISASLPAYPSGRAPAEAPLQYQITRRF